jgi:tetratricopeptide (TPR) repeat protein
MHLSILEQNLDPEALQTLDVVSILGSVYVALCDYTKALEFHRRALAGLEKAVGFKNIRTINAQLKLGMLYGELGEEEKAADVYQQNRDICASTRGITNESYLRATVNLGTVQRMGGNDIMAEQTLLSLLPDTGPNRQDLYWRNYIERAATELVKLYQGLGRYADVQIAEAWINGDPTPLLDIKYQKLQKTTSLWSPREGDDQEVSPSSTEVNYCNAHTLGF